MDSVIWPPILSTGLSEVIGSWKTMEIWLPRIFRSSFSSMVVRSRPSKMMLPPTIRPGGSGMRRMIESALTLLPQPLSPTRPRVSPFWMS